MARMAVATFVDVEPTGDDPGVVVGAYRAALVDVLEAVDEAEFDEELPRPQDEFDRLELSDVAVILAAKEGSRPDVMREELLDQLLIEMTTAVVDVDSLAGRIALDLSGKELQQRIEGRAPMTLREYALIRHAIQTGG